MTPAPRALTALLLLSLWALSCSPPAPLAKTSPGSVPTSAEVASKSAEVASKGSEPTPPTRPSRTRIAGDEVEALAAEIVAPHQTDRKRAQALYEWVAKNITYDIAAYLSNDLPNPAPLNVLATRSAVCEGYARLYVALAEAAGLEAVMVTGYSKGFSPDDGARKVEADHAWCAVKFEGTWHLLDPTWAAGHIDETKQFVATYSSDWFATPPEQFVTSHLPEEEKWQLISPAWTAEKFWNHPTVSALAFTYGLKADALEGDTIRLAGTGSLLLTTERDCRLMAALYKGGRQVDGNTTLVERQGRNFHLSFSTPAAGRYRLVIFLGEPDSTRGESAMICNLESSGKGTPFPQTLKSFADEQVRLVSPRSVLNRGQSTELVLQAPGAKAMMAVMGQTQIPLKKSGERFSLWVEPTQDSLSVFGNFDGGDQYQGLLEFPVQ